MGYHKAMRNTRNRMNHHRRQMAHAARRARAHRKRFGKKRVADMVQTDDLEKVTEVEEMRKLAEAARKAAQSARSGEETELVQVERKQPRGWCETFHACKKGDGRNFWAWVKGKGYRRYKGACAHGNGKYGHRHKYWKGKFTFAQCKAKCDRMGRKCQGITVPKNVKVFKNGVRRKRRKTRRVRRKTRRVRKMPRRRHCVTRVCKVYTVCKRTIRRRVIRRRKRRVIRRRKRRNIGGWWNKHHERRVKAHRRKKVVRRKPKKLTMVSYKGRGWCETFHACKKGDGRNFWAWTKKHGYKRHKGACAHSNGKYGRRHKYWPGKF